MIIRDEHFGGVYTGENVEKDKKRYLDALRDYNNGKYYEQERAIYKKPVIPRGYNIDIRPGSKALRSLPKAKRDAVNAFWRDQITKARKGVGPICGLQYGYASFCKLRGGKGKMQYRRFDNWYFKLLEERMWGDKRGNGIIEIGRRRSGKSSKIMWFVIQCLRTMSDIDIAVTSKTERDAQRILIGEKAHFIYQHLPLPLKPSALKTNTGELHLGKKEKDGSGNYMVTGRNSKVVGLSPKAEALEGSTLQVWIHDEMGKTQGLWDLYSMTNPALADANGLTREGLVLLTGVAGDREKFEDDLKLWKVADQENLTRVFSPGWTALHLDEFGEEDVEKAVEEILTIRHNILANKGLTVTEREKKLSDAQQQYPLTVDEAFMATAGGKWNNMKINRQLTYLNEAPAELYRGDVDWRIPKVDSSWVPHNDGKVLVLEHPQPGAKYVIGTDCYGLKQTELGTSEGVSWVWKLKNAKINPMEEEQMIYDLGDEDVTPAKVLETFLKLGNLPVAYYVDAPKDPSIFADRSAALGHYYGKHQRDPVKNLMETEPPSILDRFMKEYKPMLMKAPLPSNRPLKKSDFTKWGVAMKAYWTEVKFKMIAHFVENLIDRIYFPDLLQKMLTYDETNKKKKYDEVDAFGNALIIVNDKRIQEWNTRGARKSNEEEEDDALIPFRRM